MATREFYDELVRTGRKDPLANMNYRVKLRKWVWRNHLRRKRFIEVCRQDLLYWVNACCTLYEPRPSPQVLPFITWPHQDEVFLEMDAALGHRDLGVEKARGEGASWMLVTLFLHKWLFHESSPEDPGVAFGLVSKNEESVDDPKDPDTLFWKARFQLRKQPSFFPGVPKDEHSYHASSHALTNLTNGSTIIGYAATKEVGSGGRKVCFAFDELAKFPTGRDQHAVTSVQHVTYSRFYISTYKGVSGAYYKAISEAKAGLTSMKVTVLDWKDNPTKNKLMYKIEGGQVIAARDEEKAAVEQYFDEQQGMYEKLRRRGFSIEGRWRSPWYDSECMRANATPSSIAEELDRDPMRSGAPFFPPAIVEEHIARHGRQANSVGQFIFDKNKDFSCHWAHGAGRTWSLWMDLEDGGRPPDTENYVLGIDVASGSGGPMSSNSTIAVWAARSRQKVAAFAAPTIDPSDLAALAYAVGKFFQGPSGDALIIHENNGTTGAQFSKHIQGKLSYPKLFRQRDESDPSKKPSRKIGFHNMGPNRAILYGDYKTALIEDTVINPDEMALLECLQYELGPDGSIEHVSARDTLDAAGAKFNHGDRATADALALRGLSKASATKPPGQNPDSEEAAKWGSYLYHRQEYVRGQSRDFKWGSNQKRKVWV